jgi:aminoglycoside phosphotransferase (APT) family kinase protein
MKTKQIKNIFIKQLNEIPISIIDKSQGVDQLVKIIKTKNNTYVFKSPKNDFQMIFNEEFAIKKCTIRKIPSPKVLVKSKKYIIESLIEGKELSKLKLSKSNKLKIYFQIGKLMRKIHSIKTKGYGNFTYKGRGKFSSLKQYKKYLENNIKKNIDSISKKNLFSKFELEKINNYSKNINLINCLNPVLNHADIAEDHIFIQNDKISGIIDFADLESDDPMMDFTRLYVKIYGTELFQALKKGYGKINLKKIQFFTFYFMTWKLAHNKKINRYTERIIKCMKHLINKKRLR